MLSSSRPTVLSLSVVQHYFEHFALKSRLEQKLSSFSLLLIEDLLRHVKKHFLLLTLISVTKHSFILLRSFRLISDEDSLKYMQTSPRLTLFG